MALVDYSDSESDADAPPAASAAPQPKPAQAAFQKSQAGRIKVDLPALQPEPARRNNESTDGPPAKRARTGGAFSGFNSLLPAPKRAAQAKPKAGMSFKTSSEAAFNRTELREGPATDEAYPSGRDSPGQEPSSAVRATPVEPKLVGKATRFMPLSVAQRQKKKAVKNSNDTQAKKPAADGEAKQHLEKQAPPAATGTLEMKPKPKKSLFAIPTEASTAETTPSNGVYEPLIVKEEGPSGLDGSTEEIFDTVNTPAPTNPHSLEAVARDLNLTAAQRRQMFGRQGKDVNVTHLNIDSEYAANEQLRQAGELVEHRGVKAIAPGKHSLQQLINNAKSQQDAMEDAWAEGRRNRGEGGSKYGF